METSLSSKIVLESQLTWPSYKRVACFVSHFPDRSPAPYFHIKQADLVHDIPEHGFCGGANTFFQEKHQHMLRSIGILSRKEKLAVKLAYLNGVIVRGLVYVRVDLRCQRPEFDTRSDDDVFFFNDLHGSIFTNNKY